MSYAIEQQEWQSLPEHAQREIYDFFLFIKQRYEQRATQKNDLSETLAFSNHSANLVQITVQILFKSQCKSCSNHSANLVEEWASNKEDEI